MTMTSKERVAATLAHENSDCVPCWCGASDEFWSKMKSHLGMDDEATRKRVGDDFRRVTARYIGPVIPLQHPRATYRTVFGVEREGMGYGQPVSHPLAGATVNQIHDYAWPDPAWTDANAMRGEAEPYRHGYAMLGGDWSPYWHDAIDLMGMEEIMIRMYEDPAAVDTLLEHIIKYYIMANDRVFSEAGDVLDIFFIGNDFGAQSGPLLGDQLFRRFLLPPLARLIALGHDHGLKVMLHSCGSVSALLPAMIEAGLDAIHAVQPSCADMDLAVLKRDFGGRIAINGGIDSHHVLIKGTPSTVRNATRNVLEIMMPGGGYIAGASHDAILEETPVENVLAMFDTVFEFGRFGN